MSHRNKAVVAEHKDYFLNLTQQYDVMGQILVMHAQAIKGSKLDLDPERGRKQATMKALISQHREMGEQLKTVGAAIDALGGPSVMGPTKDETTEETHDKREEPGPERPSGPSGIVVRDSRSAGADAGIGRADH